MKKTLVIILGISLLGVLAPSLSAQDKKADAKAKREEAIKKYDKNGDGKLDAEERAAMRKDQRKNRNRLWMIMQRKNHTRRKIMMRKLNRKYRD